ncbi:MAG: aspartate carbamoyltransferase [Rickettsiales bacterium]|nr:aspartate carbamoyltransferase [Rickettsiales bacterium]
MSKLSFHHLLNASQIKESDIKQLITLAEKFRKESKKKTSPNTNCNNKILATLFFEPSTRTRFSFESAMLRLDGKIISLEQGESSSIKKGESLSDMGRIMSNYADIITIRHDKIDSAAEFAKYATVPVINAGDGANQHPTQSLVDLYTIFCEKKKLNNLKIGILGDLKYSRTVHSLLELMSRYKGNEFNLISHAELALDEKKKKDFLKNGCKIKETSDLESAMKDLDILYVTRVQEERFVNKKEFEKVKNVFHINKKILNKAKKDLIIMHPLPRVNEIDEEVDKLPYAKYFAQANYGVYIRMALLALMVK